MASEPEPDPCRSLVQAWYKSMVLPLVELLCTSLTSEKTRYFNQICFAGIKKYSSHIGKKLGLFLTSFTGVTNDSNGGSPITPRVYKQDDTRQYHTTSSEVYYTQGLKFSVLGTDFSLEDSMCHV